METINANFVEVANLADLDAKIEEITSLKSRIAGAVQAKVRGEDEKGTIVAQSEDKEAREMFAEAVREIGSIVGEADGEKRLQRVYQMEEKYGPLDVLTQIRALCEQIEMNAEEKRFFESEITIKEEIERLELGSETEVLRSSLDKVIQAIEGLRPNSTKLEQQVDDLRSILQRKLLDERVEAEAALLSVLQETDWLSAKSETRNIPSNKLLKMKSEVSRLIVLQNAHGSPQYPETWWAFDVLLSPVVRRFIYHFNSTNKETNKISKPEWALDYVETFLAENLEYIDMVIGDVFKGTRIVSFELISSILKPLREKFIQSAMTINESIDKFEGDPTNIEKSGRTLSHMIYEISVFDQKLRKLYKFNPHMTELVAPPSKRWTGITADVLLTGGKEDRLAIKWLNFEHDLANKRFESEIMSPENAFRIDFEMEIPSDLKVIDNDVWVLKPTFSAFNLIKLIENLTNHFKHIGIVKYQLKYVSMIQLKLIDKYHEAIRQNLRKYEELYDSRLTLGLIPGGLGGSAANVEPLSLANSLKGLTFLAEQFCSVKSVTDSLEQWSDELLFIQLWNAYVTGSSLSDSTGTSIFDSSLEKYRGNLNVIMKKINEFFKREIKTAFKLYVNSTQWDTRETVFDMAPSNELAWLVSSIPAYTALLRRCLGHLDCYIIFDSIVSTISVIFIEYIITNNQFSSAGCKQLKVDFEFIVSKIKDELLLNDAIEYSTVKNANYVKLVSCIRFLTQIDPENVRHQKHEYSSVEKLRLGFHDQLSALSHHELADLSRRIV